MTSRKKVRISILQSFTFHRVLRTTRNSVECILGTAICPFRFANCSFSPNCDCWSSPIWFDFNYNSSTLKRGRRRPFRGRWFRHHRSVTNPQTQNHFNPFSFHPCSSTYTTSFLRACTARYHLIPAPSFLSNTTFFANTQSIASSNLLKNDFHSTTNIRHGASLKPCLTLSGYR